ncbi:hypothetical protein FGIG_05903 [Fasciola gigantica]|uniref:C2 NT-type domain-containing protein n=1 Tax=Fasciola gigantica TaxID=46835 RepID=A0A504YQP9_FASGI|nr:hypothetical protein FGIG_05903 [Fasciola gigantica]
MDCAPMLSRRKRYHFEVVVRLHSLVAVPYVNAVTFAKLRLLDTRHTSQYSTRAEIRNHTVSWNTEHRFICKFRSNTGTNVLEPKFLKISIRMETKGGKSFYKVGFVIINLASFAAMGSATCRRRYILAGYDEKHKRQDNSLLLVSFSMRQLFGDTCFRIPPENLSNCLVEPPDSDEGENLTTVETEGSTAERNLVTAGPIGALLSSDVIPNGHSSFERRIHTLNPLVPPSERYSGLSVRSSSSISPCFPGICPMVNQTSSKTNPIATGSENDPAICTTLPRNPSSQPSGEFAAFLTKLFPAASVSTDEPSGVKSTELGSTEPTPNTLQSIVNPVDYANTTLASSLAPVTTHNRRSASCPAAHLPAVTSAMNPRVVVAIGDHLAHCSPPGAGAEMDETLTDGVPAFRAALDDSFGRVGSAEAVLAKHSSSSSVTPTSFSSTPGSTAAGSPAAQATLHSHPERKHIPPHLNMDSITDPSTSFDPSRFQDDDSACRSLPLPPHYSAYRRRCDPLFSANTSLLTDPLRLKPPDYFATDTGLLLPSRRRKSRPVADFAFPPSQMCSARPTRDLSTADRDLIDPRDVQENVEIMSAEPQTGLSLTSYRSSGLESRSSGYQSHSRQSSLESQAVAGSSCALVLTQSASA